MNPDHKKQTRRAMIAERQKNSLFWQVVHLFGSLQLALLLLATIAIACAVATFTESHFDSKIAHAMIYKAPWFMAWLALLCVNLFAVTLTRWPWERKHLGFVITHYGIIMLLIGAIIGSKFGFEGNVTLHVGGTPVQKITTNQSVLQIESPTDTYLYLLPFDASVVHPTPTHPTRLSIPGTELQLVINNWSDHLEQQPMLITSSDPAAKEALLLRLSNKKFPEQLVALSLNNQAQQTFDFFGTATIQLDAKLSAPVTQVQHESQLVMAHFAPVVIAESVPSGIEIRLSDNGQQVTITAPHATPMSYSREAIMKQKLSVNSSFITIEEYWPDLKLVNGKPTTVSQSPNNPALRAEIVSSINRVAPLLPKASSSTTPSSIPDKPWLKLALEKKGNVVSFQLGRGSECRKLGQLALNDSLSLGWGEWQLELLQAGLHEEIAYSIAPAKNISDKNNASGTPGFNGFLKDKNQEGPTQWVISGEVTPLTLDSKVIRIGYGLELKPIPFSIELLDFQVPRDEGTETPSDFRALVCFKNLKTGIAKNGSIHMNHPASYPGGIWANLTGFNYKFSQAEWNPRDLQETTLQVLYDPGWLAKWIGSLAICIGIAMMFYWKEK